MIIPSRLKSLAACAGVALLLGATVAMVLVTALPAEDVPQPRSMTVPAMVPDRPVGPPPNSRPGTVACPDEAAMQAILEIRREQGGLLDGTLLDQLSRPESGQSTDPSAGDRWQDEEFRRALRGVALSADHPTSHADSEPSGTEHPAPLTAPLPGTIRCDSPPTRERWAGRIRAVDDGGLVEALRHASRKLDEQANDLEDSQQFAAADRLRNLSRRIRREARRSNGSSDLKSTPATLETRQHPAP
ncbi:MAG: hypothetical protein ACYC4U_01680 [Pirellulaceae bacterium]